MASDPRTLYCQKLETNFTLAFHYNSYDSSVLPSHLLSRPNRYADLLLFLVYMIFHLLLSSDTEVSLFGRL